MARDRDEQEIKVTDRRLFTAEGELRPDAAEEDAPREDAAPVAVAPPPPAAPEEPAYPEPPSAAEQQQGRDAFSAAGAKLDDAITKALGPEGARGAQPINFENFIASLYMSAMFQLGMLR